MILLVKVILLDSEVCNIQKQKCSFYVLHSLIQYHSSILKLTGYQKSKAKNPDVPYILVGMKSDLRDSSSEKVTTEKGQEMKEKIGAQDYVECSSLNKIGLKDVMESVLKVLGQQIEKQKLENHVQILLLILIMALMILIKRKNHQMILIKRKNHHHQMILIKLILFYNTFFLFKYEYISLILKLLPTYSSFLLKNIILLKKRNLFQNVMKDN